jgi:hypothetical protein
MTGGETLTMKNLSQEYISKIEVSSDEDAKRSH